MDSIRGYVRKVSEMVSSAIVEADNPAESPADIVIQEAEVTNDSTSAIVDADNKDVGDTDYMSTEPSVVKSDFKGLLGWLPDLQRSAEHYLNSLASFGVASTSDAPVAATPSTVITEELNDYQSPHEPEPGSISSEGPDSAQDTLTTWMVSMSSRTEEVWKQIKHDLNEMMITVSKEPKEVATSIYQQLSAATIEASNRLDAGEFRVLPENNPLSEDDVAHDKPGPADVPCLNDLRADVKQLVSDFVSNLFGPGTNRIGSSNDRREARLQILRADPATYEVEPPLPPAHLNLHSYADWRAAYFDEATCQPLPGIPLFPHGSEEVAKVVENNEKSKVLVIEPTHPSPEELLEAHPFIGNYLTQLVGDFDRGITDGDFWSRYYYRVWLMDVTEARRQLIAARFSDNPPTASTADALASLESPEFTDWQNESDREVDAPATPQPSTVATDGAPPSDQPSLSTLSIGDTQDKTKANPEVGVGPAAGAVDSGQKRGKHRRRRKTSEKSDRGLHSSAGGADPNCPVSPSLSVNESSSKQVCESDESSSIVVLGNGDEDVSPPTLEAQRCKSPKTVEHNSDEWTEFLEAEEPPLVGADSFLPSKASGIKGVNDEADDWVEWS